VEKVIHLELSRDCAAVQIPAGNTVVLPAGTTVGITEVKDGTYAVQALGSQFRISGKDADALGLEPWNGREEPTRPPASRAPVSEHQVWDALRTCYDPEIPLNIVDLGLVYGVAVEQPAEGAAKVGVKMTLTAPGCPLAAVIAHSARQRVLAVPGVEDANVEIVWDPPWNPSMMTPEGRLQLGLD
jgi:probable FeS assembly SUF system protein SufT